jgi:predicted HTH domain antitoxin
MERSRNVTQINLRVSSEVAADLDALAQQAQVTRIDLARQILQEGIASRKRELALRLYREGKASKSRAAEVAGISLWEMMDLIDHAAVPSPYPLQEAVEAVRQIVSQSGAGRNTLPG